MYEGLRSNEIFGMIYEEYINIVCNIRKMNLNFIPDGPKKYDQDYILIMSPLIDLI